MERIVSKQKQQNDAGTNTFCPVCGAAAKMAYVHPDTLIYRCPNCTHAFSDLASMTRQEDYSSDYYEVTHRNWFLHPNVGLFGWLSRHLPKGAKSVADVGCGKGDFLRYLRSNSPQMRLVGIDLSPNAAEPGIQYVQSDIKTYNATENFDATVSLAVIEHVPDVRMFARRMVELCNPGGTVVVMTLNDAGLLYRAARIAKRLGINVAFNRLYSVHHLHHFTTKSLTRLLEDAGLKVARVHHHNAPLKSLDYPTGNPVLRVLFSTATALLFAGGKLTRGCYLQTMVAKAPATIAR